jgi:hypothetical protein
MSSGKPGRRDGTSVKPSDALGKKARDSLREVKLEKVLKCSKGRFKEEDAFEAIADGRATLSADDGGVMWDR